MLWLDVWVKDVLMWDSGKYNEEVNKDYNKFENDFSTNESHYPTLYM